MKASIIATILAHALAFAGGSWDITSFTAPSLGFERSVCVYLPEGYDPSHPACRIVDSRASPAWFPANPERVRDIRPFAANLRKMFQMRR